MQTALSPKNTKAELLAAFEDMRKKYEELRNQQTQPPLLKRKEEDAVLQKTTAYTPAALEDGITALRRKMLESLDQLGNLLAEEGKKLADLRRALDIESARLRETRQLELGAQALETLIAEFDRKEKELEVKREVAEESLAAEMTRKKRTGNVNRKNTHTRKKLLARKNKIPMRRNTPKKKRLLKKK